MGCNLMFNTYGEVNAVFEHELNEYKSVQVTRIVHNDNDSDPRLSLPLETNRVDLDPELKDAWGLPAMRVTYRDHPDDLGRGKV